VSRYRLLAAGELIGYVELPRPRRKYQAASALLEPVDAYARLRPTVRVYTELVVKAVDAEFTNDDLRENGRAPVMSTADIHQLWCAAEEEHDRQGFALYDDHGEAVEATIRVYEAPPEGSRITTLAAKGCPSVQVTLGPSRPLLVRLWRAIRRSVNV
jgi:hypothetical protein